MHKLPFYFNFLIDPIKIIWIVTLCDLLKFSQTFDRKLKPFLLTRYKNCVTKGNGWGRGKGEREKRKKDRIALEESPERLDILSACSHLFN